ncbi:MAG: HypC/HybG/HupF family hydrogenase formation chaperone [candidate division WOR-3 bacterium]
MCLAIPARIVSIKGDTAIVDVWGVKRQANLMLCPEARVNDYIIMHAGFAIQILDKKDAEETLRMLKEFEHLS